MKATGYILLAAAVGLAGCTSLSKQHWPETVIDAKGQSTKMIRHIKYPTDSSWLAPAVKDTIYYWCPMEAWNQKTNTLDESTCVAEHTHDKGHTYVKRTHDSNGPVMAGAVSSLPIAGAIVGGAALIRPSKTSVSQSNSTDASIDFNVSTINPPLPKR